MKQKSLAMAADQGAGFERYRKPTRRDEFLQTMEAIEAQAIAVYVRSAPTFVALRTNARPQTPDVPSSRRSP